MTADEGGRLRVNVLGPLQIFQGATRVELSANRLRTTVAVLAMSAGESVSMERLAHALWGDRPPVNPRRSAQTSLSRLRRVLGREAVRSQPGGYRLEIEFNQVDALRFHCLLAEATLSRGTGGEREILRQALTLWRGTPFDGVRSASLRGPEAARLTELHLTAVERWIDLSLAEGLHGELAAKVWKIACRHPLRETLWERLLLILDRCGRRAEALAAYEQLRRRLAEDLGADPSPELQNLHSALLLGNARQDDHITPRQFLADCDAALKEIDQLLTGNSRVSMITGTAGGMITSRQGLNSLVTEGAGAVVLDVRSREEAREMPAERLGRQRAAARLFRLLALHPGPDISGPAIACLAGLHPSQADQVLDVLLDAHLVRERAPGRFATHGLMREYAWEPADAEDREAGRRLIQYYTHTAYAAARLLDGAAYLPAPPSAAGPGTQSRELTVRSQAVDWLRAEHAASFAILRQSGDFPAETISLASAMALWCDRQGLWWEQIAIQRLALAAAESSGNVAAQAEARQSIAAASIELDDPEQARAELDQALELSRAADDQVVRGLCLLTETLLIMRQLGPAVALSHAERCLDCFREAKHDAYQARTLNLMSRCHAELGQHAQALSAGEAAMAIAIRVGDRTGHACSLATLGRVHHALGQHHRAVAWFEHAVTLLRDLGHRVWEEDALRQLADLYQITGQPLEADRCLRRAEAVLDEIGHGDGSV
jgi:DNA-binding SARP family transcriptional activator